MRIQEIRVQEQITPRQAPVCDALQTLDGGGSVTVQVRTEDGVCGQGSVGFGRIAAVPTILRILIESELAPLVIGQDLRFIRGIHDALLRETEYHGSFGLAMFGIAALDIALWDCLGKTLDMPCWVLWGAVRNRIPAYAMVGWLNYNDDQIQDVCTKALEQGFRAVKIKVGFPTLKEDLDRIRFVRRVVGDDIAIMVDANQSLSTAEAICRGRAFEDLGCYWWEEPIPAHDVDGYAQLAHALDIPIATGENLYTPSDFQRFLRAEAVDIVQADVRRAGGPTALLQIGALAEAFHKPYASHGGDPVQLNVMACLPNAMYLETGLLSPQSPFELKDGYAPIPTGPGFSWE